MARILRGEGRARIATNRRTEPSRRPGNVRRQATRRTKAHADTRQEREHMLLHTAVVRAHPPAVLVVCAEPGRCFIASSGACIPRGFTEHIPFPGYHIVFEYPTPKIRPTVCLNLFKDVQRLQHISLRCPTVVNKNHRRFPVCFIHTQPKYFQMISDGRQQIPEDPRCGNRFPEHLR